MRREPAAPRPPAERTEMKRRLELGPAVLEEGELRGLEPCDGWLVCLAKVDGAVRAIDDWCNHSGCLISGGWIERQEGRAMAVCPCHEIGFDLETGENLNAPDIAGDQRVFRVVEEAGRIWIEVPPE